MRDAVIDLMGTYYVFDIALSEDNLCNDAFFFQHTVFNLMDKHVLPTTTSKLVCNLSKLS